MSKKLIVVRLALIYVIDPRAHAAITAWLAGTHVGRPLRVVIKDHGAMDGSESRSGRAHGDGSA